MNKVYIFLLSLKISFCGDPSVHACSFHLRWQSCISSLPLGGVPGLSNFYFEWHMLRWLLSFLQIPFRSNTLSATSVPPSRCPGICMLLPRCWALRGLLLWAWKGVWNPLFLFLQRGKGNCWPFSRASPYLATSPFFFSGALLEKHLQSVPRNEAQVLLFGSPTCLGFLSTLLSQGLFLRSLSCSSHFSLYLT